MTAGWRSWPSRRRRGRLCRSRGGPCPTCPWLHSASLRLPPGGSRGPGRPAPRRDRARPRGWRVVGQVAVQAARLLGAGRVVAAARWRRHWSGHGTRCPCRGRPARRRRPRHPGRAPARGVRGCRRRRGRPAGRHPGHGRGPRAHPRRAPGEPRAAPPEPALSVDSAALRSRSAAVLGYTNNALTDHRRRGCSARSWTSRRTGASRSSTTSCRSTAHPRRGTRSAVARHPGGSWSAPSPTGDDATTGRTEGPPRRRASCLSDAGSACR